MDVLATVDETTAAPAPGNLEAGRGGADGRGGAAAAAAHLQTSGIRWLVAMLVLLVVTMWVFRPRLRGWPST